MSGRPDYRGQLLALMASRGMYSTGDLRPLLAGRDIHLSLSQVYRLAVDRPERLSLELIEPVAGGARAATSGVLAAPLAVIVDMIANIEPDLADQERPSTHSRPASSVSVHPTTAGM